MSGSKKSTKREFIDCCNTVSFDVPGCMQRLNVTPLDLAEWLTEDRDFADTFKKLYFALKHILLFFLVDKTFNDERSRISEAMRLYDSLPKDLGERIEDTNEVLAILPEQVKDEIKARKIKL